MGQTGINLGMIHDPVTCLGPGSRIGLWVRGCSLNCPGCLAPELASAEPAHLVRVSEIHDRILALAPGRVGLTISGGEPFEQAGPLTDLVRRLRRTTDLDFLVYSGFTREEIQDRGGDQLSLLSEIDILIDGRFREELPGFRLWRGSDNQVMHLLTSRARSRYRHQLEERYGSHRPLQFHLGSDNSLLLVGIPDRGFRERFDRLMADRGLEWQTPANGTRPMED